MRSWLLTAFTAGVLLFTPPAKADFHVCNLSASPTEIAFGYYEPQDGWSSRGWMKLQTGECKTTLHENLQKGTYYVYGRSADGREFAGPASQNGGFFCIQREKFELHLNAFLNGQSLNCEGGGMKTARFLAVDVASPDFTYTISPTIGQIGNALAPLATIIRQGLGSASTGGSDASNSPNTPANVPILPAGVPSLPASAPSVSNVPTNVSRPNGGGSLPPLPPPQPAPGSHAITSSAATMPSSAAQATAVAQPSPPPLSARPSGAPLTPAGGSPAGTACQRFPNLC